MGGDPVCFYWKPLQGFAWRTGPLGKGVSRLEAGTWADPHPCLLPEWGQLETREPLPTSHHCVGSVGAVAVSCPSGPYSPAWAGICTHFTDAETKGQELNLLAWDHQLENPSELKPSY